MTKSACLVHVLGATLILLLAGCSSAPEPAAEPPPASTEAEPATEPPPAAVAEESPAEVPAAEQEPAGQEPAVEPPPSPPAATEPVAEPPAETAADSTPAEGWAVVDVGGEVEVGATLAGLSRIGATKCKICHQVQYASWAESSHGTREPPIDCEGCHGPGSAYKSKKVMEDPEAARAAGMVIPDRAFCEQCHKGGLTDELMTQAHEHEAEGG